MDIRGLLAGVAYVWKNIFFFKNLVGVAYIQVPSIVWKLRYSSSRQLQASGCPLDYRAAAESTGPSSLSAH